MAPSRNVIGVGLAAIGLAGGVAATQLVRRRHRQDDSDGSFVGSGDVGSNDADADAAVVVSPDALSPDTLSPDTLSPDILSPDILSPDTEVHVVEVSDGARLRVLARGSGPPVVLLHGITLAADVWFRQLRYLADAGFRVVAPDLRGHGRSTIGTEGLRLDRVADDIAEILTHLDLDGVVLVGHSLGGMIALRLLTRDEPPARPGGPEPHPATVAAPGPGPCRSRIVALGLVATSASPVVGRGVPGVRAVVGLAGPLIGVAGRLTSLLPGPSLPDADFGDPLARATFGSGASAPDVRLIRRITARVPARVTAPLLLQLVSFDAERHLGQVSVPTTVVVGTDDVMTPVRHAETLVAAIADAELVVLPDCGHMVMMERPEALEVAVVDLAKRAGVDLGHH